jgi:hypothetical protein
LSHDEEEGIYERASSALMSVPLEYFLLALARADVAPALYQYCAENLGAKPGVADAMAGNASCPAGALEKVAMHLTSSGIQTMLDQLERLAFEPALIAALAASPNATPPQQEALADLQKGALEEKDLEEVVFAAESDPEKRKTLVQRLAKMNVVQRVQMALKGGREERIALIRDANKVVQRAVLQSPRLTESEVESFAAMTTLTAEILRVIAGNRLWMKNYSIARNLTSNSKTPLDITLHLLPRLNQRDLKILASNKNVPETLRSTASKMDRKRNEGRKES